MPAALGGVRDHSVPSCAVSLNTESSGSSVMRVVGFGRPGPGASVAHKSECETAKGGLY